MNINYDLVIRLVFFIIGLLLVVSCTTTTSQLEVDPSELLIGLTDMPDNWYVVSQGELPDNYRQQGGASTQRLK